MSIAKQRWALLAAILLALPMAAQAADVTLLRTLPIHILELQNQMDDEEDEQSTQSVSLQRSLTSALREVLELSEADDFIVERERYDTQTGQTHFRLRQTHNGVPVWNRRVVVTLDEDMKVQRLHGSSVADIQQDLPMILAHRDPNQALEQAKQLDIQSDSMAVMSQLSYKNEQVELSVYLDQNDTAHLAHVVSFFRDQEGGGAPARPVFVLDANTGEVVDHYDGLTHNAQGTGPGGNQKTGQYYFGSDFDHLEITASGSTCYLENDNVRTINLDGNSNQPHSFSCYENTYKNINGGFSPANDAHYFGGVVFDMFDEWYNTAPLDFQLTMRVHYGSNYENAFWNGSSMTFGDGANRFYPLVDINVSAHEVAHGFTEQNSGLIYRNQSGGINEAFSDMAGEAAEYYMHGEVDWHVGAEIFKGDGAIRYMDDPPRDGNSIDSANDFFTGMDVHHSSGVFNKAFYLLATTDGWDVRQAFDIFVKANQDYWTPSSNYQQGAQAAVDAAADLGYPTADVVAAFAQVDVIVDGGDDGDNGDDTVLENGVPVTGLAGEAGSETFFTLEVPAGAQDLNISISGGSGDADLYVRHGNPPTTSQYDCRPYRWGNEESCDFATPDDGRWHVMIRGYESYANLTLEAQYQGAAEFSCSPQAEEYEGSLTGSGDNDIQPDGNYYYSGSSGSHSGVLNGPSGADFDLQLYRWSGSSWTQVASSSGPASEESIDYQGNGGYYYWDIRSSNGSGDYRFCLERP